MISHKTDHLLKMAGDLFLHKKDLRQLSQVIGAY